MSEEIWKEVPKYPNYKISNYGRVEGPGGIKSFEKSPRGKHIFFNDLGKKAFLIKRVMYELFVGPINIKETFWFKDGNSKNIRLDNLEKVTKSEWQKRRHALGIGGGKINRNKPDTNKVFRSDGVVFENVTLAGKSVGKTSGEMFRIIRAGENYKNTFWRFTPYIKEEEILSRNKAHEWFDRGKTIEETSYLMGLEVKTIKNYHASYGKNYSEEFGNYLKNHREKVLGVTQKQLASMLGLSVVVIDNVENNKTTLEFERVMKICQKLQITVMLGQNYHLIKF